MAGSERTLYVSRVKRPQNMEERCYSWRARDGGFLKGRLNGSEAASEVRNDCPA